MVNLLAIWRAHGIDEVLRDCWQPRHRARRPERRGDVLVRVRRSRRSAGPARVAPGLGFVPGILSVHYHRDDDRRRALRDEVAKGATRGYGIDDGAGVLVRGSDVAAAISARDGARAWRVEPDGAGGSREVELDAAPLPSPRPAIDEIPDAVIEMRELKRAREVARRGAWSRR